MKHISLTELRDKIKPLKEDPLYTRAIIRKISIYVTWLFLHTGISPNQVTILSQIIAIIGATFFISTNPLYWIFGWAIMQVYIILDGVDGEVARYSNKSSVFGIYFDAITHPFVNAFIFIPITFSVYAMQKDSLVFLLGFSACGTALFFSIHRWCSDFFKKDKKIKQLKISKSKRPNKIKLMFEEMFRGAGGFTHMALVPAVLDLGFNIFGITIISFRYLFLIVAGIVFPIILIRRIYCLKVFLNGQQQD